MIQKHINTFLNFSIACLIVLLSGSCDRNDNAKDSEIIDETEILPPYDLEEFVMGVDLSYVNQIKDKGGSYAKGEDPYKLFADMGANLVRLRLWHNPEWIKEVYNNPNEKLYSGFEDVKEAAKLALEQGMDVCLDFHYSDTWADPGKQHTPAAWESLSIDQLKDSVYNYTYESLNELKKSNVIPAYVQIGNEINPGMLHPLGHHETNNWLNLGELINEGIRAINDVFENSVRPKIIIHIAQPENIRWFFNNLEILGKVRDFDVIGVSYYSIWSSVELKALDGYVRTAIKDFDKELMIMETAFNWIGESFDQYTNIFGSQDSLSGHPISPEGQLEYMKELCQEVITGGGSGVVYWEPAWISSDMKTQWGQGSAWENCSFFDFRNNNVILPVVEYITYKYQFEP